METNVKTTKIILTKSSVAGKAPTADIMESGEAFVNLAKGTEHLYFKNAENEVIATKLGPLDKELDETSEYGVENQAIAKKYNELKKQLDLLAQGYSIYGFARVNGDNSPDGTIFFGKYSNLEEITSHIHMGLTTKEGKLYKRCANCRLDVAVDGTALKIDGTDGDVMLFTDSKLYFLKGTVAAPADLILGDGVELNIIAFGMVPFSIYGVNAKAFDPFALNPQYTVNCQIPDVDNVECAHSIYNPAYAGIYYEASNWFNETFKPNGNGYPSSLINSMDSIWYAQGKNADQKTNRPYMGGYYEFYEIFIALMFCELKSVYHQQANSFGTGCTNSLPDGVDINHFAGQDGYSGGQFVLKDSTTIFETLQPSAHKINNNDYLLDGLCGDYSITEMLEPIRVLNDIAKAGLISKIWDAKTEGSANKNVIFEYDETGNMKVSDLNINSGIVNYSKNMVPNHKYYQVRNVPNTKGMADGAMTAVINIYVKMTFKDGLKLRDNDGQYRDLTGGCVVYKFSHPVYRGMCLQDGMFSQLQGCHYVNYCPVDDEYVTYFKCAENVDDIPAQQARSIEYFGDVNKDLEMERGLTKVVQTSSYTSSSDPVMSNAQGWAKKADYNASLLCYTQNGGSMSTGECAFFVTSGSLGNEDTDATLLPPTGRKCVNAVVVGGITVYGISSARSVFGVIAVGYGFDAFAGRFSIPHLQL